MPLTPKQRYALLMAGRTGDAGWIAAVIEDLLKADLDTNLLEIDQELRDAGAQIYLVAGPGKFQVVTGGWLAMRAAVARAGMTAEQNRAALADKPPPTT